MEFENNVVAGRSVLPTSNDTGYIVGVSSQGWRASSNEMALLKDEEKGSRHRNGAYPLWGSQH